MYEASTFSKENDIQYQDVDIVLENVRHDLLSYSDDNNNDEEKINPESLEEISNSLDSQRGNS